MNRFKKNTITIIFCLSLLFSNGTPVLAENTMTIEQQTALIQNLLQQIQILQKQLAELKSSQAVSQTGNCIDLKYNFGYNSKDLSYNNEVSLLQNFLQSKGYLNSAPTGFYGPMTTEAVRRFQIQNGVEATGYLGPITREKIQGLSCATTQSNIPKNPTSTQTNTSPANSQVNLCSNTKNLKFPTFDFEEEELTIDEEFEKLVRDDIKYSEEILEETDPTSYYKEKYGSYLSDSEIQEYQNKMILLANEHINKLEEYLKRYKDNKAFPSKELIMLEYLKVDIIRQIEHDKLHSKIKIDRIKKDYGENVANLKAIENAEDKIYQTLNNVLSKNITMVEDGIKNLPEGTEKIIAINQKIEDLKNEFLKEVKSLCSVSGIVKKSDSSLAKYNEEIQKITTEQEFIIRKFIMVKDEIDDYHDEVDDYDYDSRINKELQELVETLQKN